MAPATHAEQSVVSERGCIVQIQGDGNTVVTSLPHLRLTRYRTRRTVSTGAPDSAGITPSGEREADLLRAYTEAIPFVGRDSERTRLNAWLDSAAPISVRVLIGRGGRGKTRLALEMCRALAEAGWRAGFVTGAEMTRFRAQTNLADWGWNAPTLVVLDYAAAFTAPLRAWLAELADNEARLDKGGPKLRLLVLERHATPGEGWWAAAFGRGGGEADAIAGLLDGPEPDTLDAVCDPVERRLIFNAAYSRALEEQREILPELDECLAGLSWGGEPLFLAMAGLLAARMGLEPALALPPDELAFRQAERELARVRAIWVGHGLPKDAAGFATHLAALATLRGGLPGGQRAHAVIRTERQATGFDGAAGPEPIRAALHEALPGPEGSLAPVEPDPLGEAVILEAWRSLTSDDQNAAVLRAYREAPDAVAAVLVRACQDFAIYGGRAAVGWLRAVCGAISEEPYRIQHLLALIPEATVELREIAADLTRSSLRHIRDESERARALNNLSVRLSALGQREEALAAAQEAVALYDALAEAHPDALRPDLVKAFNVLSNCLSALDRREEALAAIEQAVALHRVLELVRPGVFRLDLARALDYRSKCLSALGQREEALAAAREAVALCRELDRARPNAFRSPVAAALSNLSACLAALDHREEALKFSEEAVALYRELAATRPDAFRPDLAAALNHLSVHLSALGHRDEALAANKEAVALYGALAEVHPDAFRPDLVAALNNLSVRLSALGHRDEALAVNKEAVAVHRELEQARPGVFRSGLAMALSNLSARLYALGRWDEALASIQEAVALYRELAQARPDTFQSNLASALNNLSNCLSELDRRDEALTISEEAVALHRELEQARPGVFQPGLAMALGNLSARFAALRRWDEALTISEEAVVLHRELEQARPGVFQPDLARVLNYRSVQLSAVRRHKETLTASEEAVALYRELAQARPDIFRVDFARSLLMSAWCQEQASQPKEACASAREAEALLHASSNNHLRAGLLAAARSLIKKYEGVAPR